MTKDNIKSLVIACLLMVFFGALLNGVLINLLLTPSHLLLVEQLSAQLVDLILFLAVSLILLMVCQQPRHI